MAKQKQHSLLLVDDHQFVRMALRMLISALPGVATIDEACSLAEGIDMAAKANHDLVLLDLNLPDSAGLESLRLFMHAHPDAKVALVTGDNTTITMETAMQENIRGYVAKSQRPEIIAAAVGLMLAGERYIPADLYATLASRDADSHGRKEEADLASGLAGAADVDQLCRQLSPRLRDVLELVTQGKSNKEISTLLGLSQGTVKNYVSIIFERLNLPNRSRTISYVAHLHKRSDGNPK